MLTVKHLLNNNFIQKHCFLDIFKSIGAPSIHTSVCLCKRKERHIPPPFIPKNKKKDPPSDFLPFPWSRPPKNNLLEKSGDLVKFNEVDPTSPKPDFEFSEELKTANEIVKNFFSVDTASYTERREVCRRQTIKRIQRHPLDFDSLEVKIANRTVQVRNLYEHKMRAHHHDRYTGIHILIILIQKRNSLLKKLWLIDEDRFNWILKELKLFLLQSTLGPPMLPWFTRKNDMRRLTKEYCEKMIADKRATYHETLKKEQELFKEEKAEALAWIAEEEKAIKALDAMIGNQ